MSAPLVPGAPVGLIAGAGRFPIYFAEKARDSGIPVVCLGIKGMADPVLAETCAHFEWLRRLSLSQCIRAFKRHGATRFTMCGKIYKHLFFQPWRWLQFLPDWRSVRLWYLRQRSDRRDDSLLLAVIREFQSEGIDCASALDLCPELLVKEGLHTKRAVGDSERRDIAFGWGLAREMGRLDIGQSVMVRQSTVLAVEAIEGTDAAILRAGELCRRGKFVVVKVAKPRQDMRFDVPTVGPATVEAMKRAGAVVLAVEAGRTILIDEAATVARADELGLSIIAGTDETLGVWKG